jgi:hypothetical protein
MYTDKRTHFSRIISVNQCYQWLTRLFQTGRSSSRPVLEASLHVVLRFDVMLVSLRSKLHYVCRCVTSFGSLCVASLNFFIFLSAHSANSAVQNNHHDSTSCWKRPLNVYKAMTKCLCFFLTGIFIVGCSNSEDNDLVRLSHGVDESAGDVPCYVITTPTATYYLEKEGGGLSSMLDVDGVDWIGFHKEPGSASKGEYRGFPNAVHKQDGSYFHALNAGTDKSTSLVEIEADNHVRIDFTSGNGLWKGQWDFFTTHCTFVMKEISPKFHYWILYEGVPGGELDKTDFWFSSKDSEKHSIDERQNDDLPDQEWMAFGDVNSPRMIFLKHHEDDNYLDRYYNMRDEMTVFGFGREGGEKFLNSTQNFSIGFVEADDYDSVDAHIGSVIVR